MLSSGDAIYICRAHGVLNGMLDKCAVSCQGAPASSTNCGVPSRLLQLA